MVKAHGRNWGDASVGVPMDPGIRGLRPLAEGALSRELGEAGVGPTVSWTVLKHHPGSRCTLLAEGAGRRVIVKAYAEDPSHIVALMDGLSAAGLASGRAPTVPPVLGADLDLYVLVSVCFDEPQCRDLIALGAPGGALRAGALAAEWLRTVTEAEAEVKLGPWYGATELLREAEGWVERLRRADRGLAEHGESVRLELAARPHEGSLPGLRHGSFSASHVFDLGSGPGVVDWDGFRQGPVEFDAGRFLAGLSSMAAGRRHLAEEAAAAGRAFTAALGELVEAEALTWYRAGTLLRLGYYASVRRPRRWQERAAQMLDEAAGLLAELR